MGNKLEFYFRHLSNWITKGNLVNRVNLSSLGIRALYNQIITKSYIKKVYCISKFPIDYYEPLMLNVNKKISELGLDAKVYLNTYSKPVTYDINNDVFKRKRGIAEDNYYEYEKLYNSLSQTDKDAGLVIRDSYKKIKVNKNKLDKLKEMKDSYSYVVDLYKAGGKLTETYVFIEIMASTKEGMSKCEKAIESYLSSNGFIFKSLSSNASNFMVNFAPAGYLRPNNKEFSPVLLSDENLSYLQSFITCGFIGNGNGQLLGLDVKSKQPLILDFFGSGSAQVNLIEAPSGYGKTILAFMSMISMMASGVHVSYLDVKGNEGRKLIDLGLPGVRIDFRSTSKTYVNTLRLDDLEITNMTDAKEFIDMSTEATVNILKIIYSPKDKVDESNCEHIARLAVAKLFSENGVKFTNLNSLCYTANFKYEDLIPKISAILESKANKQYAEVINSLITKCTTKFIVEDVFKGEEITLSKIIDSPLVIYELGRNQGAQEEDINDMIKSTMITYLDSKKISLRKKNKQFSASYYEEVQSKDEFKNLLKYICGVVTRARASNVTVFLLCNSINLMNSDDMRQITSNITTSIIGAFTNEDDYSVLEKIGAKSLRPKIEHISKDENKNKHWFAVKYNTGKEQGETLLKCEFPKSIMEKLKTREEKKYGKD